MSRVTSRIGNTWRIEERKEKKKMRGLVDVDCRKFFSLDQSNRSLRSHSLKLQAVGARLDVKNYAFTNLGD